MAKQNTYAPVRILQESWEYLRKQPVLSWVLVWLLILPTVLSSWVDRVWKAQRGFVPGNALHFEPLDLFYLSLSIFFALLTLWGVSAVLLVGKRMVVRRAGRTRSSFRRVILDALPMVFPLLLTSILQQCLVFYRALLYIIPVGMAFYVIHRALLGPADAARAAFLSLLILSPLLIPAVVYWLRTILFPAVFGCEEKAYREALQRSSALIRGRFGPVVLTILALALLTFLPAIIISWVTALLTPAGPVLLPYAMDIIHAALSSTALLMFILAMTGLYGRLKENAPKHVEV